MVQWVTIICQHDSPIFCIAHRRPAEPTWRRFHHQQRSTGPDTTNGRLARIDVGGPGVPTAEGVQVGDSEAHALQVYGPRMTVCRPQDQGVAWERRQLPARWRKSQSRKCCDFLWAYFPPDFRGVDISPLGRLSATGFAEQAQNFEIQPDERDHQAEGAVPLHVFRRAVMDAGFNHVEVQDEIKRGDNDDEKAEGDAPRTALMDHRHLDVEKHSQDHFDEIQERDAAGRGEDADLELFSGTDHAPLINQEHYKKRAKGKADGLDSDSGIRALENGGDAAEDETFE